MLSNSLPSDSLKQDSWEKADLIWILSLQAEHQGVGTLACHVETVSSGLELRFVLQVSSPLNTSPAETWRQCFICGHCSQSHGKTRVRRRGDWSRETTDPRSHQHPHGLCAGSTPAGAPERLSEGGYQLETLLSSWVTCPTAWFEQRKFLLVSDASEAPR